MDRCLTTKPNNTEGIGRRLLRRKRASRVALRRHTGPVKTGWSLWHRLSSTRRSRRGPGGYVPMAERIQVIARSRSILPGFRRDFLSSSTISTSRPFTLFCATTRTWWWFGHSRPLDGQLRSPPPRVTHFVTPFEEDFHHRSVNSAANRPRGIFSPSWGVSEACCRPDWPTHP